MENETSNSSQKNRCEGHCHSTKFILGLLVGVAVSFILGFAFITIFAGNLLKNNPDTTPTAGEPSKAIAVASADEIILSIAKEVQLDTKELQSCLDDGTFKEKVQDQSEKAAKAGIQGTPNNTIISKYGVTQASGALPLENLKTIIDGHLDGSLEDFQEVNIDPVTQDDWIKGDKNAPISIVEYSDIDCPFCKRHHPTLDQLVEEYDGQVNWVYRHFPLDQLHPDARKKAEASECAGDQGGNEAFWEFLDLLYKQ